MRKTLSRWTWSSLLYLSIVMICSIVAFGQARSTASRGGEIKSFGQFTYLRPDSGPTNNIGFSTGVDYTRFVPLLLQPSLEIRVTHASGETVGENTYAGGVKLAANIHDVHPYVDLLDGFGTITFTHPALGPKGLYSHDESAMYSYGGGIDFDVQNLWQMRVDVAQQYWNLKPPVMTPMTISVGITYRIPFGSSSHIK